MDKQHYRKDFRVNCPFQQGCFSVQHWAVLRSSGGTRPNSCNRSCKSEPKMYNDWLKHSLSLENHNQEIFFFLSNAKTNLSTSKARGESQKSWVSAESVLSASMTWLVVNWRFMSMASFPESEELRNPSKTHISTGYFLFKKKKGKTSLIPLKFLKCSLRLNASTTVAQNTCFVLFFAKWEVALVEKAQV